MDRHKQIEYTLDEERKVKISFIPKGKETTITETFETEQASHNGRAMEAIDFYTSVFGNSGVVGILNYTKDDDDIEGTVKHSQFRLDNSVYGTDDLRVTGI